MASRHRGQAAGHRHVRERSGAAREGGTETRDHHLGRHGRFERCTDGLPAWFDDNVETSCLDSLNDGTFAAFGAADGRLF
jgi:hypothetical protein